MNTLPSSANSATAGRGRRARREQAVPRLDPARAGVKQHEAARSISVLRHPRRVARLAEERGLLVAGDARDRNRGIEQPWIGRADHAARRPHLRQDRTRHAEEGEELVVPGAGVDVVEKRARSVGGIGDVQASARQLPYEPGVDRPESELAPFRPLARTGHRVQEPRKLGRGEVGVEHEPGLRRDPRRVAVALEACALVGGAAVLPDDRVGERRAGAPVPEDRRLPLVRDADPGEVAGGDARVGDRLARDLELGVPDLFGVVLHPAGLRKDLPELGLRHRPHRARLVEHDGARAGGALIEGKDERHGDEDYERLADWGRSLATAC